MRSKKIIGLAIVLIITLLIGTVSAFSAPSVAKGRVTMMDKLGTKI